MKLILLGEFTDLNTYINAERSNRYKAADIKNTETLAVKSLVRGKKAPTGRCRYQFSWYCINQKKDPDNISFAQKFFFDGMKAAGVIENDGWKQVGVISHEFYVDKQNPRIEVIVTEID